MLALPIQHAKVAAKNDTKGVLRSDTLAEVTGVIASDVSSLIELRVNAITASVSVESSIDHLSKYAVQLINAAPRLDGYDADTKFEFDWNDAFAASRSMTSGSLYFELSCILWNIAASYSLLAVQQDRKTIEGLKLGCKYFQHSVGVLEYMKTVVTRIKGGVFPHFTDVGLQFAINLMLAQAQYTFYMKAVMDRDGGSKSITASIIAKIASQVSLFYTRSYSFANQPPLKGLLDVSWTQVLQYQLKCFYAYAEFFQSKAVKENSLKAGSGYGEEIARLHKSLKVLREVITSTTALHSSVQVLKADPEKVIPQIETSIRSAERDNNTVYLDRIPDESTLSHIDGVVMVKGADPLASLPSVNLLFKGVIPLAARVIASDYRHRVQGDLSSISAEANQATNLSHSLLSDVGLPGSLESYKSGGRLSENLWAKVERTQNQGGLADLLRRQSEVEGKASRASASLEALAERMERERKDDASYRVRYSGWAGTSSVVALQEAVVNFTALRDAFATARMTDGSLADTIKEADFIESMQLISLSRPQIVSTLPGASVAKFYSLTGDINTIALEHSLDDLSALITERDGLLNRKDQLLLSLDEAASANLDTIIMKRISAGESSEMIETSLMVTCDEIVSALKSSITRQPALLDAVLKSNQAFISSRMSDPSAAAMDDALAKLERSVSRFYAIQSQLSEGVTFYSNLQV